MNLEFDEMEAALKAEKNVSFNTSRCLTGVIAIVFSMTLHWGIISVL